MAFKETIDIEALLHRAYFQHRVDRVGASAAARMIGLDRPRGFAAPSYGERVDTSAPGSRLAARAAEASSVPDDILTLHDRVLALADMWFAWGEGGDVAIWDLQAADVAGCTIEKAGDDWWLVAAGAPVTRLVQAGVMVLVIQHARSGSRPDVHTEWVRQAGERSAVSLAHDHRSRRRKGEHTSEREVQHDRACYHAWRCALALLAAEMAGELATLTVIGPSADPAPWLSVSDCAA